MDIVRPGGQNPTAQPQPGAGAGGPQAAAANNFQQQVSIYYEGNGMYVCLSATRTIMTESYPFFRLQLVV